MKITPIKKAELTPVPDPVEVKKAIARPHYVNTTIYGSNTPTKEVSQQTIESNIKLLKMFRWIQTRSETSKTYQHFYLDTHGCEYILRNRMGSINPDELNELIYNYNFDMQLEDMLREDDDTGKSSSTTG